MGLMQYVMTCVPHHESVEQKVLYRRVLLPWNSPAWSTYFLDTPLPVCLLRLFFFIRINCLVLNRRVTWECRFLASWNNQWQGTCAPIRSWPAEAPPRLTVFSLGGALSGHGPASQNTSTPQRQGQVSLGGTCVLLFSFEQTKEEKNVSHGTQLGLIQKGGGKILLWSHRSWEKTCFSVDVSQPVSLASIPHMAPAAAGVEAPLSNSLLPASTRGWFTSICVLEGGICRHQKEMCFSFRFE